MTTTAIAPDTAFKIKGALAAAVGVAIGTYGGFQVLVPAVAGGLVWFVGRKMANPASLLFLPSIAVQGGHLAWLLFGMAYLGQWGSNVIDLVVLSVGLAWLWLRPGIWPIVLITAFQGRALAVNLWALSEQSLGTQMHRALVVHIALRIAGVFLMWQAYWAARRAGVS